MKNLESELRKARQKAKKLEQEKKKIEEKLNSKRAQLMHEKDLNERKDKDLDKLRKEKIKLKKTNEKLQTEVNKLNKEAKDESSRWRKKVESLKKKLSNSELEKVKAESKLSSLGADGPEAGPSGSEGCSSKGLFQDMLDNFKEFAESQLQCAVCNEIFVEAVSVNCGHTFCDFCINEWKKKKNNCPVCRTNITREVTCKVLNDYTDKLYEQFMPESGRAQRKQLKEERDRAKSEATAQRAVREREAGSHHRRNRSLEMVNIILNRTNRRRDDDESSLDSDATLELHLSDGHHSSDTEGWAGDLRTLYDDAPLRSETDSSDDSFRGGREEEDSDDDDSLEDNSDPELTNTDSDSDISSSSTDSSESEDSDFS